MTANWARVLSGPSAHPDRFEYVNAPAELVIPVPRSLATARYRKVRTVLDGDVHVAEYEHVEPAAKTA